MSVVTYQKLFLFPQFITFITPDFIIWCSIFTTFLLFLFFCVICLHHREQLNQIITQPSSIIFDYLQFWIKLIIWSLHSTSLGLMILKQMVLKFNTNSFMLWLLLFWNIYHENWIYFTFANIFAFSHFWTIFWRKLLGKMFSSRYFYFQRNFIKIFLFFFVKIGSKYSRWEVHCSI